MVEQAELEGIFLELPDDGIRLTNWKQYRFNEHFLTPSDGWSFTLGDESISDKLLASLTPGKRVNLMIAGHIQSTGYIDQIEVDADRNGGVNIDIQGRDRLGAAVKAGIDPQLRFTADMTILDLAKAVYTPFGWSTDDAFVIDNDDNRNVITGSVRGKKTTKLGKILKKFKLHQIKPYPNEGAHSFFSRVAQRQGLYTWPTSDGSQLVVGKPDFDQESRFTVLHKRGAGPGARNNVLRSHVTVDGTDQCTMIVATGFGSGGENNRGKLKTIILNELTAFDTNGVLRAEVQKVLDANKSADRIPARADFAKPALIPGIVAFPEYLHDDESKTLEQLQNFARREMALRQHKALIVHYTVEGHMNNTQPWCVDTIVDVDDDVSNLHERMWVLSRTFIKSRTQPGTITELELIRPGTLFL